MFLGNIGCLRAESAIAGCPTLWRKESCCQHATDQPARPSGPELHGNIPSPGIGGSEAPRMGTADQTELLCPNTLYKLPRIARMCGSSQRCAQHGIPTRIVLMNNQLNDQVAERPSGARQGAVRALRRQLRMRRKLITLSKVCSLMTLLQRRRKGSGDLPGLQSRRFGPSRAEWWIRLPHASAKSEQKKSQREQRTHPLPNAQGAGHPLLRLLSRTG